jgi:aryl-alcohol dehydrogenase-like predicted oxidoreductase
MLSSCVTNLQPGSFIIEYHAQASVQVIKGNWQLSGGHRGSSDDDRTLGSKAIADFDAFVNCGITTFDTADIYGPSEKLIGEFIRRRPEGKEGLQILTKFCKFGNDQISINQKAVTSVWALLARTKSSI